ncbi:MULTISPECIES: tRNA (guanosine(46)-N7)-methyltransferase TrmB [Spirulina sp. CCY15215]|uniref:tRNA (guanosine(46)-N7)-methyltransferase TrmB n=1 Tax=Spirulina sp. CCY15215 TaxID=2767591 RepID=UPI0019526A39|nr:tRNA (guanosine(46)-N7)-methyltransferase TrmB [Spirulina major]
MTRVRVRQHVNPLSGKYQIPLTPPDWRQIYAAPQQPLHLDIGCARGRFILEMAQLQPQRNFLGLEIREPLVTEANHQRDELKLSNLHYLFCNVNISLSILLESLPDRVLDCVTIQFPDPWFKKRHVKRRVVQPELVEELARSLPIGATVFLQSDVAAIASEMREQFQHYPQFSQQYREQWLEKNPFPVTTEREKATFVKGEPVYRCSFFKENED